MNNDYHKYRVWDDETKEYVSRWVFVNYRGEVCRNENGTIYPHKCVVEECTGLHDRNGKLIYEGDIVECLYGNRYWTYTVRYDPELAGLYYYGGSEEESESFDVFYHSEKEIVGNIHEGAAK